MIYFILLLIMTLIGSVASLFLKQASSQSNGLIELIKNFNCYLGGALYFISALLNIIILRYLDYSIVLPLTSVTYIWTMILSYWILKEKITKKKVMGVGLIVIGAVFLCN